MPPVNPKNVPAGAVAGDLGIAALLDPEGVKKHQDQTRENLTKIFRDPLDVVSAADELFPV